MLWSVSVVITHNYGVNELPLPNPNPNPNPRGHLTLTLGVNKVKIMGLTLTLGVNKVKFLFGLRTVHNHLLTQT